MSKIGISFGTTSSVHYTTVMKLAWWAVSTATASHQEFLGFESTGHLGPFCVKFVCFPCGFVGSLWVL